MSNSYVGRHRAVIPHRQVGRHRATRPGLHGWTPWLRWAAVNERTNHAHRLAHNPTSVLGFLSRFVGFLSGFADSADGGRQRTLSGKVGHLAVMTRRVHPGLSGQRRPADPTEQLGRPALNEPRKRPAARPIESSAVHATGKPHPERDRSRAQGHAVTRALVHASSVGAP
jgi:hypothetical protein